MDLTNITKYTPPKTKNKRKYKVCFYSNSISLATGYAKVLKEITSRLARDPYFEVHLIGENEINTVGPRMWNGCYVWGMGKSVKYENQASFFPAFMETFSQINPDVLIVLEDSFTLSFQGFMDWSLRYRKPCPMIFYLPLDGKWTPTNGIPILRMVDKIVSMAQFTQWAAKEDGFDSDVIYHGVDLFTFKPITEEKKKELRKKYNIPEDCFLIFNYGRNNMRKSNQRLCYALAEYLKDKDPNKYLSLIHI